MALITLANGRVIDTEADDVTPEDMAAAPAITTPLDVIRHPVTTTALAQVPGVGPGLASAALATSILAGDPRAQAPAAAEPQAQPMPVAPAPAPAAPAKPAPAGGGGGAAKPDADLAALGKAQGEQEKALQGEVGVAKARAKAEAGIAADAVADKAAELAERAAHKQAAADEYARLSGNADAEDQKYRSMGYEDFWSRATIMGKPNTVTGARIVGFISIALGAAGAALTKGPNYALEQINSLIAQDYQRQRDNILKQKDVVKEARGLAADAKAEKLLALENWRKNAYELTEAKARATLAGMGEQAAEAKGASALAELHEKVIESKNALEKGKATLANIKADTALKRAEAARTRDSSGANRPLTEGQSKAADLGGRMLLDNEIIEKTGPVSDEGLKRLRSLAAMESAAPEGSKTRAALMAAGKWKTPEQVLNERDQVAFGARRRFAASVLRGDSGAAIGVKEYIDFDAQNFEQLGEKPASAEGKRLSRQQMIQGKLRAAGPAAASVAGSVQQMPAASAPAAQPRRGTVNGQRAMIYPDGTYEIEAGPGAM